MNPYVTGAVIKELREEKQLTQLQLAEKLGVSDKTISKWETARAIRISPCWSLSQTPFPFRLQNSFPGIR